MNASIIPNGLSRLQSRPHKPFVSLHGGQQIASFQMLMIRVSDQDTAWTIKIPLVLPFEVRYVRSIVD